jgi:transcriptional regulator with XRE-family HTH domain
VWTREAQVPGDASIGNLIRQAREARGWGPARLAREVGIAEGGGPNRLERQAVYRWETGKRKPSYWLPYLIQVLDLDLRAIPMAAEATRRDPTPADTVMSVLALGRNDVDRRNFLAASSGYALSALALPDLESVVRRTRAAPAGTARVGEGEVAAVRQMVKALGDCAAELGGGHARHLAVRYLTQDVAPWLNGTYTESTGRRLFAATSQLVHLAGWMAQDEGNDLEHRERAQQYYAHAYRLAAEAGDPELSATALRGLAVHALDLGHRAEAVELSEACVRYGRQSDNARAVAYYEATLANAAAQDSDRRTATRHLALSESAINRSSATSGESWAAHYSPGRWAHESGMILSRLGDLEAVEEHLHLALEIHGLDRRRTRAIVLADLGGVRLRRGDLDGAVSTWHEFVGCAEGIRSVKIDDAVADMRVRLRSFHGTSAAEELQRKADLLTA